VRLDDVLVAGSLIMVVVGSQSCGEADSSERLWLCWSGGDPVGRSGTRGFSPSSGFPGDQHYFVKRGPKRGIIQLISRGISAPWFMDSDVRTTDR
jgi:hypothetical protein